MRIHATARMRAVRAERPMLPWMEAQCHRVMAAFAAAEDRAIARKAPGATMRGKVLLAMGQRPSATAGEIAAITGASVTYVLDIIREARP